MDIGVVEDVFELRFFITGIDGHQDGSDFGGSKHEGEPVGHILSPNADLVAGLKADVQQPLGQPVDAVVEPGIGEAEVAVGVNDEFLVRGFQGPFFQDFAQCVIDELHGTGICGVRMVTGNQ